MSNSGKGVGDMQQIERFCQHCGASLMRARRLSPFVPVTCIKCRQRINKERTNRRYAERHGKKAEKVV